jgi:diguanylate cyclase (GGDEF)-like protein/PAS domain S-box-containing protein
VTTAAQRKGKTDRSPSARVIAWLTLADLPAPVALVVIGALYPVSWALGVYLGGAAVVAPHWLYLPIFLAGLRFGPWGALVAGITATFVAGPLLPADVTTGASQRASDWMSRGVFFVLIGELVTYLFVTVRYAATRAAQAEAQGESEQRFRALVQRATDMITVTDEQGRFTYESPAVERILGWAPGQRLGVVGTEFLHPDDRRAAADAYGLVLKDPTCPQTLELRLLDSRGEWRWVESTMTNLLDEPTVRGIVINHRDVDERKALEDELIHRAFHDSLTGLANRGFFRERVDHSIAGLARSRGAGGGGTNGRHAAQCGSGRRSVLFIDLDDFKTVNDAFGHDAGDRLLVEVSNRLLGCVGPPDVVARLGGDEFGMLIEEHPGSGRTGVATAARQSGTDVGGMVAQRVIDALEDPFDVATHQIRISASIGIAPFEEGQADADSVLMQADIAMYDAKANGKGRFVYFSDEMQEGVRYRLNVESWLRAALGSNQIRVHYQPIVCLKDRHIEAVEALVRWQHPTMGLLSPADFISVAEETGLIVPLGKLVLQDACHQIRRWRELYDADLKVSVNLSATQLRDPAIVEEVLWALDEAGVDAEALLLEVTEGAIIGDIGSATDVLECLSALGVTIAVDDFGTGYSSLSHLQRFPVDVVKVDKAFVDGMCRGGDDSMLVRSVLAIGAEFGLQVVAEGIQTEQQHAELRRLGCAYGQGYLYQCPVPARRIDEMLRTAHSAGNVS